MENHSFFIHQDEKYFEISKFSGEWVLRIPTAFMYSFFAPFAITGLS